MDEIRPPQKEDLVKLCEELNRLAAKYVVIGGLAMNNLGLVRTTEDIDFLIEPSPDNQRRLRQALLILPEKAIRELGADEDLQQWILTRINDEVTVDLMTEACGVRYEEAKADVQLREVQGVPIPMANRQLMIKLKQSPRPKDQIDLEYLLQSDEQDDVQPWLFAAKQSGRPGFQKAAKGDALLTTFASNDEQRTVKRF